MYIRFTNYSFCYFRSHQALSACLDLLNSRSRPVPVSLNTLFSPASHNQIGLAQNGKHCKTFKDSSVSK